MVALPVALAAAAATRAAEARNATRHPNVLLVIADDLNTWIGPLRGHPQTRTPHLDRLARRGVTFTRAYCAAPLCTPSRAAILTGVYPSSLGMNGQAGDWSLLPSVATLPRFLKQRGYYTAGAGKIYHERHNLESEWDEYFQQKGEEDEPRPPTGPMGEDSILFAPLRVRDDQMRDAAAAAWISSRLRQKHDRPFFLACGLHKPHLPWEVPQAYFDALPPKSIVLPRVMNDDLSDIPGAGKALTDSGKLHRKLAISGQWREAVRAYLAAISFSDAMVGRLLSALEQGPNRDQTIVVFLSDNGFALGQKECWRKFTLWEESTHVPLLVAGPGIARGAACPRTVDLTSLYATLAELIGATPPSHVQGPSLARLLRTPSAAWERPALTSYQGHLAVRSEEWTYIRYADTSEELYAAPKDPLEWWNLAGHPELAAVKRALARWIPAGSEREKSGASGKPAAHASQ